MPKTEAGSHENYLNFKFPKTYEKSHKENCTGKYLKVPNIDVNNKICHFY